MQARSVEASHGWQWIKDGFALFRKNPVIWIVLFLIYLLIAGVLTIIPLIGPLVLNLMAPVFIAGFMLGCRALEQGDELEINHLFAGFKQNTAQLITVGGLYLAGVILIVGLIFMAGGGTMLSVVGAHTQDIEKASVAAASGGKFMVAMLALVALVPLMMAYWFAPILVLFHDMKALDAMKASIDACMMNILPFTVYGLISMVLIFFAALPFGLGLIVMIPTMMATLYISYKDIFMPMDLSGGEIAM